MSISRTVGPVVVAAMVMMMATAVPPVSAQEDGEARLGGSSDVVADSTVQIPQGGEIPPLHYIFADNPTNEPIRVEFVADTPTGITVEAEWEEREVPANSGVENRFGIAVGPEVAAGEYPVVVQLVRSDIESQPGRVTNLPAVQTSFTVDVTGETATIGVEAVSALSGQPVAGTLKVAAATGDGDHFEVARVEGSSLEAEVAPGEYRVSFLLGDRTLATQEVTATADDTAEVTLEVETVSFVVAAARPTLEDGRPVVVDLSASVNNEAEPITGTAVLQAVVVHQDSEVDTVTLTEADGVPLGVTEGTATYRPTQGWNEGTYQFRFQLVTSEFTLTAPDPPSLNVPPPSQGWDIRILILVVAGSLLVLLLLERLIRVIARRVRARQAHKAGRHTPDVPHSGDDTAPSQPRVGLDAAPAVKWAPPPTDPAADSTDDQPHPDPNSSPWPPDRGDEHAAHRALVPPPPSRRNDNHEPTHGGGDATRVAQSVRLAQRLADQGTLSSEWSIADAALVYWAMTSQEVRDALLSLGMSQEEYTTALTKLLQQGLLDTTSR